MSKRIINEKNNNIDLEIAGKKPSGWVEGYLVKDSSGTEYMLKKMTKSDTSKEAIREYIAAPIFEKLIPGMSPEIFVINNNFQKNAILSKYLPKSKTFKSFRKESKDFSKISNFAKMLAATMIIGDDDPSLENVMVSDKISSAKIDHGHAFTTSYKTPLEFISNIYLTLYNNEYQNLIRLNNLNFNIHEYYEAIKEMTTKLSNKEEVTKIISQSIIELNNSRINPPYYNYNNKQKYFENVINNNVKIAKESLAYLEVITKFFNSLNDNNNEKYHDIEKGKWIFKIFEDKSFNDAIQTQDASNIFNNIQPLETKIKSANSKSIIKRISYNIDEDLTHKAIKESSIIDLLKTAILDNMSKEDLLLFLIKNSKPKLLLKLFAANSAQHKTIYSKLVRKQ